MPDIQDDREKHVHAEGNARPNAFNNYDEASLLELAETPYYKGAVQWIQRNAPGCTKLEAMLEILAAD